MNCLLLINLIIIYLLFEVKSGDYYIRDGNSYYISYPDKGNWFQALRFCAYNKMNLIDVRSDYENDRILAIIKANEAKYNSTNNNYWTSGTDNDYPNQWYWLTSGQYIIFRGFASDEPTSTKDKKTHCIYYKGSASQKWSNNECTSAQYYICRNKRDASISQVKDKVGWADMLPLI